MNSYNNVTTLRENSHKECNGFQLGEKTHNLDPSGLNNQISFWDSEDSEGRFSM